MIHGDRILETDPTEKHTGVKSDAVLLDMNSLYPSAMSHYSLPRGNYKWFNNPCASNFPGIATVEEKHCEDGFLNLW